jgi:hypothetical protein
MHKISSHNDNDNDSVLSSSALERWQRGLRHLDRRLDSRVWGSSGSCQLAAAARAIMPDAMLCRRHKKASENGEWKS